MKFAQRLAQLGTETAFAVSAEATAYAKEGHQVFPFHLGDINLKTPQNIIDAAFSAANKGKTGYCPNSGIPELRACLAEEIGLARGVNYDAENVVVQPGGKPSIGKFILSAINPGDEVLYPNPGYPIYESQIEFHGGKAVPYSYKEGPLNFELDLPAIEKSITSKTRAIVYNDLQNPTGAESTLEEMQRVADIAIKHDLIVLSDEAYFDIRYEGRSQSIASLPGMKQRTLILYTFSKKYAMTGWRLGASIGPKKLIDIIAKLNVNDESCSNHFIQFGAIEALTGCQSGPKEILTTLKTRRDKTIELLEHIPGVRCYRPNATFYLYPNVTKLMFEKGFTDYEDFRKTVLKNTGVAFCTRAHFGRQDSSEREYYIRLAYSGIDVNAIEQGMEKFKRWAE